MFSNLLANNSAIFTYVILGVLIVAIVVMFVFSSKRRKKQEEDAKNLIDAVKPGNKVKTIGGICGLVVEVDKEENTFVLETGSEQSGKCFIKFDRQAIYQTDAVVEKADATAEVPEEATTVASETTEKSEDAVAEEAPAEVPAEATPAEDKVSEEPVEKAEVEEAQPKKKSSSKKNK